MVPNQNVFTGEDVRVSAKQFGLGEKGTVTTRSGGQHSPLSYYISVLRKERKLCTGPGQSESYKESGCNISYGTGNVKPENRVLFFAYSNANKTYLNLIRVVYSSVVLA